MAWGHISGWSLALLALASCSPTAEQQAEGPFPAAKGSMLRHDKLIDFIQRNYEHDEAGQWFFQNGPQRVYVELEAAPWVWRVAEDFSVSSHAGTPTTIDACLLDDAGRVYLATPLGLGLVHTQDVGLAADAIEQGRWPTPEEVQAIDLPLRFGHVRGLPVHVGDWLTHHV